MQPLTLPFLSLILLVFFIIEEARRVVQQEDPCKCESLIAFQSKVNTYIESLTSKHILYLIYFCFFKTGIYLQSAYVRHHILIISEDIRSDT